MNHFRHSVSQSPSRRFSCRCLTSLLTGSLAYLAIRANKADAVHTKRMRPKVLDGTLVAIKLPYIVHVAKVLHVCLFCEIKLSEPSTTSRLDGGKASCCSQMFEQVQYLDLGFGIVIL
jgi:hypothetical protein